MTNSETYKATVENAQVVIKPRLDGRYFVVYYINGTAYKAQFENSLLRAKKAAREWLCSEQDMINWEHTIG